MLELARGGVREDSNPVRTTVALSFTICLLALACAQPLVPGTRSPHDVAQLLPRSSWSREMLSNGRCVLVREEHPPFVDAGEVCHFSCSSVPPARVSVGLTSGPAAFGLESQDARIQFLATAGVVTSDSAQRSALSEFVLRDPGRWIVDDLSKLTNLLGASAMTEVRRVIGESTALRLESGDGPWRHRYFVIFGDSGTLERVTVTFGRGRSTAVTREVLLESQQLRWSPLPL